MCRLSLQPEFYAYGLAKLQEHFPTLSKHQQDQLIEFVLLLEGANLQINLTSLHGFKPLFDKHILDSLAPCKFSELKLCGLGVDIGSGAGLPSIALSIALPELKLDSLESQTKKVAFQKLAQASLGLKNFEAYPNRIEQWSKTQNYDWVFCRALGSIEYICNQAQRLLKDSGHLLLYKGPQWPREWYLGPEKIPEQYFQFGFKLEAVFEYSFNGPKAFLLHLRQPPAST